MSFEWKLLTVGKFCPFKYGKGLPERVRKSGVYGVYSSAGLVGCHEVAYVNTPGIVIGRKGTVGSVTFSANPFWPIDTAYYVEDEPDVRNIHFTYYLLKTLGLHLMNTDSAVPGLNRDNAHAIEVRIPPLGVQENIADFLKIIDDRISLLRETNATLESIAQALFKSWFIDFDPVRAKVNGLVPEGMDEATAALFPDRFEESDLGMVPSGWELKKIGDLLNRPSVKRRFKKDEVSNDGEYPVYEQGSSILLGYQDDYPSCNASPLKPLFIFGDHTCITKLSCEPFDVSQNVILLEGSLRNSFWTYYAIEGKQIFEEYRRHWMELISKSVILPSASTCDRFAEITLPLQLKLENNLGKIKNLSLLRDTLLPRLISGQISIPEAIEITDSVSI